MELILAGLGMTEHLIIVQPMEIVDKDGALSIEIGFSLNANVIFII